MKSLLDTKKRRPMDEDESAMLIAAMLNSELAGEYTADFAEAHGGFGGQVLQKRLQFCTTTKITCGLAIFLVVISKGSPGNLVMWTYTLHRMNKGKMLTIDDFVQDFPMGIPSEQGYSEIWDAQKDHGRNMMDDIANWA